LPAPADARGQIAGKTQELAWHDACCVLAAELRAGPPCASFVFELETMSWVFLMH
jgi:hypothetical protein